MKGSADAQRRGRDLRAPTRVMPRSDDSGAVAVIVALSIVVLLGIGALAVDIGYYLVQRGKAQTAADAAALAAASYLPDDKPGARTAAIDFATRNLPGGTTTFTDGGTTDPSKAAVTVSVEVPTFFAQVFGIASVTAEARAVAQAQVTSNRRPLQIIVVQDASGSFFDEWAQAMSADLALMSLINQVSIQGDKVGFVAFSDRLKHSLDLTALNNANPSVLPADIYTSYQIALGDPPGGYTHPELGINWAITQLIASGSTGTEKVIVFVSDGMPNPLSHRGPTISAAQDAGGAGIRINTVTLTNEPTGGQYGTSGADYQFNKNLVEVNNLGGVALQTSDPAELSDLLLKIARFELRRSVLVD